jgi:hypothetical protein
MKISGRVIDYKTDTPLENASVVIQSNNVNTAVGTRTNSKGEFTLDSPLLDNLYNKVAVSYVGYDPVVLSPSAANSDVYLMIKGETLAPVTVWAKIRNYKLEIVGVIVFTIVVVLLMVYIPKIKQIKNL